MTDHKPTYAGRSAPPYHWEQSHCDTFDFGSQPATYYGDWDQEHRKDRDEPINREGAPSLPEHQPRYIHDEQPHRLSFSSATQSTRYGDHGKHQGHHDHHTPGRLEWQLVYHQPQSGHQIQSSIPPPPPPLRSDAELLCFLTSVPPCSTCPYPGHNLQHDDRGPRCHLRDCQKWVEEQDHRILDVRVMFHRATGMFLWDERCIEASMAFIERMPNMRDRWALLGEIYERGMMERRVLEALMELKRRYYYAGGVSERGVERVIRAGLPPQYRIYFDETLTKCKAIWKEQGGTDFEIGMRHAQGYTSWSEETEFDEWEGTDENGSWREESEYDEWKRAHDEDKENKGSKIDGDSNQSEERVAGEEASLGGGFVMTESVGVLEVF